MGVPFEAAFAVSTISAGNGAGHQIAVSHAGQMQQFTAYTTFLTFLSPHKNTQALWPLKDGRAVSIHLIAKLPKQ